MLDSLLVVSYKYSSKFFKSLTSVSISQFRLEMVFVLLQAFILCVVSFVIFSELGPCSIEFVSKHLVLIYLYQVFATRLGDLLLVDPTFKHAHLLVFP